MLFFDRSREGLNRVMGITLGHGRTSVSEELLYYVEINSLLKEAGGIVVSKIVKVEVIEARQNLLTMR